MELKPSPFAPKTYPDLPAIKGVELATTETGLKYKNRQDLLWMRLAPETQIAGVFTKSLTCGAPVEWCKNALASDATTARAIIVNAGNANAFTGKSGYETTQGTALEAAKLEGCLVTEIYQASTGVIGEPMDAKAIADFLPDLHEALGTGSWADAAEAIRTTDTFAKMATRTALIGDSSVTINGIAKGSGMIAPDMATMLGFIATDAKIPQTILQELLSSYTKSSFNAITVDGDTSTSDTVLLAATGQAEHVVVTHTAMEELADFKQKLDSLMVELALSIIKDGEGIQKLITLKITGAESDEAAHKAGLAVANSPLVKTAVAGADANWGRIVMAVGKCGERANRDKLKISIGGVLITDNGEQLPDYDETPVAQHMQGNEILIEIDLGIAEGNATVWGCDLTYGYIDINGSYRS